MKLRLEVAGETCEVRVLRSGDRLKVTLEDGRVIEARLLHSSDGTGAFELELGHARLHAMGLVAGPEQRQLWLNGRTFAYRSLSRSGGGRPAPTESSLSVAIPALVVEVLVAPGQQVTDGEKLVLLESMKMVLPVVSPRDGRVATVNCAVGESVAPGLPLVTLEDEDESP